jgi:integrase
VAFTASITKRDRTRTLTSGAAVVQTRFVVNFRHPATGRRKQIFVKSHKEAIARRDELIAGAVTGSFPTEHASLTVAKAIEHWLENRKPEVKRETWRNYRRGTHYIVGPLLTGTSYERRAFTWKGTKPAAPIFLEMLGGVRVGDLSTGQIRSWHRTLAEHVGAYSANLAKKFLRAALALAAEDFGLRVPAMPSKLGRGRPKTKKAILTPEQVGLLLKAAVEDKHKGIYYAFPFLTGVRPSEQLGLLWEDVDLEAGVIRIRRMLERDGTISEFTKTAAGTREIPVSPLLKSMLLEWRVTCPRRAGQLHLAFPGHGWKGRNGRRHAGRTLLYSNFRTRYWQPVLGRLGLPHVAPHSARHAFISTLQAKGVEVGLVAKLAGHANAAITLSHYTQAVRGGKQALESLEQAYTGFGRDA